MSGDHHNAEPEPYPQLRTKAIESLLTRARSAFRAAFQERE